MTTYITNGEIVDVLWMCREPRAYEELHRYLIDSFGNPPGQDPHEATREVIDQLVDQKLLKAQE